MGLEKREERPGRPWCHHERGRPQGEGYRCAPPPPEAPRYRMRVPAGSEARLYPGITPGNGARSLQSHFFLSNSCSGGEGEFEAGEVAGAGPVEGVAVPPGVQAAAPDAEMTAPAHDALAARGLAPGEHYADSGYPSAGGIIAARRDHGITLVSPLRDSTSRQARAGQGYDMSSFRIDFGARQATCPQGQTSTGWTPVTQRNGAKAITITFPTRVCPPARPCRRAPPPGAGSASSPSAPARSTRPRPPPVPLRTPHPGRTNTPAAPASRAPSGRPSPSLACAIPATAAWPEPAWSTHTPPP